MLVIGGNDFVALDFAAGFFLELASFHLDADILNLLAIQGVFADTEFETVVLRRIVACRHFYPAIDVEMKQRKIEQRRGTNTDIVNLQPGRRQACDNGLCVRIGGRAAITPHRHPFAAPFGDDRAMHLAQEQREFFVEILFRQTPDVVLTKYRRIHFVLRFISRCANLAASRIASFMLDSSAFPLPAMS